MKRDRELHEPDENHRYLDEAGEKRAEDGRWLEGLPRGGPEGPPGPRSAVQILHRNPRDT